MLNSKVHETLIIIPSFNEGKNIAGVLEGLASKYDRRDILVINDGSWDSTAQAARLSQVKVIDHPFNMGIGASFQTGCKFAVFGGYRFIVRIDADGQHSWEYLKEVLRPVRDGEVDICVGSRFLGDSRVKSSPLRLIGIFVIAGFLRLLTGKTVTDPTSGFCAMNKKAFDFFSKHCVDDYPEPEILLHYRNFRIKEVPIEIFKRRGGTSSITPFKSIYYMFKVLFSLLVGILRKENV